MSLYIKNLEKCIDYCRNTELGQRFISLSLFDDTELEFELPYTLSNETGIYSIILKSSLLNQNITLLLSKIFNNGLKKSIDLPMKLVIDVSFYDAYNDFLDYIYLDLFSDTYIKFLNKKNVKIEMESNHVFSSNIDMSALKYGIDFILDSGDKVYLDSRVTGEGSVERFEHFINVFNISNIFVDKVYLYFYMDTFENWMKLMLDYNKLNNDINYKEFNNYYIDVYYDLFLFPDDIDLDILNRVDKLLEDYYFFNLKESNRCKIHLRLSKNGLSERKQEVYFNVFKKYFSDFSFFYA